MAAGLSGPTGSGAMGILLSGVSVVLLVFALIHVITRPDKRRHA